MVLEQPMGILTEAAVRRTPRRLHVRDVPVPGPEHAQKRFRMHRAGADLDVERLLQRAAARGPELGEPEDQALERHGPHRAETRSHLLVFSVTRCLCGKFISVPLITLCVSSL